jgi:hypothetical protein
MASQAKEPVIRRKNVAGSRLQWLLLVEKGNVENEGGQDR